MLPAIIASFLGRMAIGEAAATATGARAVAAGAASDFAAARRAVPRGVPGVPLTPEAIQAAQNAERLGIRSRELGEAADKAAGRVKSLQTQTVVLTTALAAGSAAGSGGGLAGGLDAMARAVDHLAQPVKSFVELANPAKAALFDVTMKDAHAVVGRELIPVMDAFTRTARKVGDVMAGFEPVFEPAIRAVANMVDSVGSDLTQAVIECEPEIKLLALAIEETAKNAAAASYILRQSLEFTRHPFGRDADNQPGRFGFDKSRTSVGASAQEARFVGAKTIADEAIRSALTIGATIEQDQLKELKTLNKNMEEFINKLDKNYADTRTTVQDDTAEFQRKLDENYRRTRTTWKD